MKRPDFDTDWIARAGFLNEPVQRLSTRCSTIGCDAAADSPAPKFAGELPAFCRECWVAFQQARVDEYRAFQSSPVRKAPVDPPAQRRRRRPAMVRSAIRDYKRARRIVRRATVPFWSVIVLAGVTIDSDSPAWECVAGTATFAILVFGVLLLYRAYTKRAAYDFIQANRIVERRHTEDRGRS